MISFSLISHSRTTMERLASPQPASAPVGRPMERYGAMAIAAVAALSAVLLALAV
ncbi:hypothetical protein [Piscinibacter sp. XHJ-5]|uniref:hypothetical protein n=1 Tax=Piscinibacter sp. XHJ-5 TaxID=3037797 RepID=UPI002452E4C9|nr:hypothetical protein [Piscinibacter sp. XHJ-5]